MATEKLQPNQIYTTGATAGHVLTYNGTNAVFSAPASGAQQQTVHLSVNAGTADKTLPTFSFVVGMLYIEILDTDAADANDVLTAGFVNMRSFSGTKTANITDRVAMCLGEGDRACTKFLVDRTTSGTVIVINRPQGIISGTNPDSSVGITSITNYNWPITGRIRATAWEDTQA